MGDSPKRAAQTSHLNLRAIFYRRALSVKLTELIVSLLSAASWRWCAACRWHRRIAHCHCRLRITDREFRNGREIR